MQLSSKIFLLLCLISTPVHAWAEMITGTVVAIDREQNSFILRIEGERTLQVRKMHSPLPRRMKPGRHIRIWGSYNSSGTAFRATDIRGVGKNRHHDQTGVRARIGNGKYCRKEQTDTGRPCHDRHPNNIPTAARDSGQQ